jgi:hypothetical protein
MRHSIPVVLVLASLWAGCPNPGEEPPTPTPTVDDDDDASPVGPFTVVVEARIAGQPTEGVSILQGGGPIQGTTGPDGRFLITLDPREPGETLAIAALPGHRSGGVQITESTTDVVPIEIAAVVTDNPDYPYGPPGVDGGESTADCSHCHIRFAEQFGTSAHRQAAADPQVHDLFAGTASGLAGEGLCDDAGGRWLPGTRPGGTAGSRCYVGDGLLPDATDGCGGDGEPSCDDPDSGVPVEVTGSCADCHAPGIPGAGGGGYSLLAAEGLAFEDGVHCDLCHKVASIDPAAPPGVGGRLVLGRPYEEGGLMGGLKQVMYGPYPDVTNPFMGGAWAPVYSTSEFCRGCHEYDQAPLWDDGVVAVDTGRWPAGVLPVHSTYSEWAASSFAGSMPCQGCHMPAIDAGNAADIDLLDSIGPGIAAGYPRAPGTVRSHAFIGPSGETATGRLLDTAAVVALEGVVTDGTLELTASVSNVGAGHAIPTGEPLRSLVLVVDATCEGAAATPAGGEVVSRIGGALATGVVGTDVVVTDATVTWPAGVAAAEGASDLELRVVRPLGTWDDYPGVPPFDASGFAPSERGREQQEPVARVAVTVNGDVLDAATAIEVQAGDVVYLARRVRSPSEGDASLALAGLPGRDFARVLVDAEGTQQAPHYRANDVLRDDRILPGTTREVVTSFVLPEGCISPEATAVLVYRAYPLALARERGWDPREAIAATGTWIE